MNKERQHIRELEEVLGTIEHLVTGLHQALESGALPFKDQVDAGQVLWRISNLASKGIEPLKNSLRKEAEERCGGKAGKTVFHGRTRDSRCTVVIPRPSIRLREGVTVAGLRAQLGEAFDTFFRVHTQVQAREDFADQAVKNPEVLPVLTASVDTVTDPGRVSFLD